MAIKPIITAPNTILTSKAEKVQTVDGKTKQIVQDLIDTLNSSKHPQGAGLAAPQIGLSKQICIVRRFISNPNNPEEALTKDYVLINPKLMSESKETSIGWEGCLSIPDTYGKVQRAKKVKVKALNENGEEVKYNATGFFARVMQHEMDHLQGILFTTKVIGKTMTEEELDSLPPKSA